MVSVLDLAALRAESAHGGVRHVAGPADGEWPAAALALTDEHLADDGGGRLAILATPLPAEPWRTDALLRRVRDRSYAALAVPGAEALGQGARRLADRIGLLVLEAERPFELAETCWRLALARDAVALEIVRRLVTVFRYPARDLRDLLAHLAAATGRGVALLDASGVLEEAGGELGPAAAAIDWERWTDLAEADDVSVASVRVDSPSRPGLRLAFFATGIRPSQLRALAVAADVAMPAVAARILIDEVAAVSDASVSADLLREFLELRGAHDADVERRMLERGWRQNGHHLGFRIVSRGRVDPHGLLRSVTAGLSTLGLEHHATVMGRGVTGWLRVVEAPAPGELEAAVGALRSLHESTRRAFNVATGVGSLQRDAPGLAATLGEAADAARIASDRSSTGWFVRVDTFGLEQLLLARTENDTFLPAAESLLAPLRGEDDVLLRTLAAYLDNESGIAATADALEVHRNTVSTRMQRIQELLGVDMGDPGSRLALHLACRALLR
ncbi:PucR family transcriptional regulator [Microbacterium marinilacus]|uniref:PucR family transcriptional regulator n=1 Tax=Microbacterium marinilacus TaxID=415209 RepID=A0ABP7B9N6_9MICO|nr:PucR family transcriptional regulator [Microbacterium marinilacus]MBY0687094.1 helix-turn-helix domain-containing protein [Microbacterium marinilacus]